ncbi:MAG: hypothetical protein WBC05_18845 [Sedimentisphaerales bacterium]
MVKANRIQMSGQYRPGKSALDAVGITRQRCWRQDWVIDLDIKGFFDKSSTTGIAGGMKKAPERGR